MTCSAGTYSPYVAGTNPGDYTLTMSLKNTTNYQWSDGTTSPKTYTLVIIKKVEVPTINPSSSYTISGNTATAVYSGSSITMAVIADSSLTTASGGNDSSSSLAPVLHKTDVGSYSITIALKNTEHYVWVTGGTTAKTYTLTITKASVTIPSINSSDKYSISGRTATAVCTGEQIRMTVGVNYNPNLITCSAGQTSPYINGTNAGTYTLTMSLKDTANYKWSDGTTSAKTYTLNITGKALSSLTISSISAQTYKGSAITPTITIKDGTTTLTNGTHYALSYSNNVNVGIATVTITGKGSYGGKVTKTFTISARNISNASFGTISTQYYNKGTAITPTPTITDNGISKTLTNNTDFTFSYSNNVNVGSATITITGKGNYTGTKSTTFTINGRAISNATIGTITNYTYDGTAKKPTATVTDGSTTLSSTSDFTFSWSNNINAGTATLVITGKGNYSGTKSATFTISARNISNATVGTVSSQEYTGSAKNPAPTLTDNGINKTLANNTDYTLSYASNINVGTATITITGKGNYTGTKTATFSITARSITHATVGAIEKYYYDGTDKEPTPAITDGSETLQNGVDFEYGYRNNLAVGTATLIITGKGNYSGVKEVSFVIEAPTISTATVTISQNTYTYDGTAKEPSVTLVQIADLTLIEGVDFTVSYSANVNAGTAKVILTGTGDYSGTKEITFTINPADISYATVSGLQIEYTYTGIGIEPPLTLTLDGKTLIKNTDYLIVYSNNLNVGNATITITGSRNYTGTLTDGFTIVRADLSSATITGFDASPEYTGSAIEPLPVVNLNGLLLTKDTEYILSYTDNTELGTATITVTGLGNFTGTATATFVIVAADISSATVTGINASYDYTGSAIEPTVTVTYNGTALTKDTGYTVTYSNNIAKGTATVTITGIGNYTGTITQNFNIGEADIDDAAVTGIDATYDYTGSTITPEPIVTFNGAVLTKDTDYTVAYTDNKELGIATITISGLGNFNSTKTVTFEIVAADISKSEITGIDRTYDYTGSAITPSPTVTYNGKVLTEGTDYTVTYRNNTNLGAAIVVVTGMGNYTNVKETAFTIIVADIASATVTGIATTYQWTGGAITASGVTVTLKGVTLVKDRDYVISYDNNIEVGIAAYTVTGIGNYKANIEGTFEITKALPNTTISYVDWDGTDTLFVGKSLPQITATANYNGSTVAGSVAWNEEDGFAPSLKGGEHEYRWTFTPDDTDHFFTASGVVKLTAQQPNYVAIIAEWKDTAQPELFTSTSFAVIKQNLKVTGIFNSGDTDEIEGGFSFVITDSEGVTYTTKMPTKGGKDFYITVSFGALDNEIFNVEIKDVVLTELTVDDSNAITNYIALDTFDTASITVTAKYNDGVERTLDYGDYGITYEKGKYLQYGDEKITVSFTDGGVPLTKEIAGLSVSKKPFEGTLTLSPEDKDYNFGNPITGGGIENLPDWVTVTYEYEDEEGNIYTDGVKDAGAYKVTAKFTVDDNHEPIADIEATFKINPIDPVITPAVGGSLAVGTLLSDLTFTAGNGATAGTLTWDESAYALKEGINRCYYTFTPDDAKNYNVIQGYVDIAAEVPQTSVAGDDGSLAGWQIALIVICVAVALVALILALKLRGARGDDDGFYDDVTEQDLLM